MGFEQIQASGVVPVACIDQNGYRATSARRISSICSDTSERPL